jgi:steroid 5-alpha reductase family enzyme
VLLTRVAPVTGAASWVRICLTYVAAVAAAVAWVVWGPDTGRLWLDALLADLLATLVVFVSSRLHRNSSLYDAYWSLAPPLLALFWWAEAGDGVDPIRSAMVVTVVVLWSLRLTANWVYAFPGLHHEDWRYPLLRARAGRAELLVDLFAIHVVPTSQVFLGMLPVYVALTGGSRDVGWVDAVALVVGLGAVAVELVADLQMHRFVRTRSPGEVMDRGLWGWSRHPNHFGELGFWCALLLFGVAASPGDAWWMPVGALAILAMFLGASIPMMEQRSLERRPGYQDVVDRVPMLVPRPPRRPQDRTAA